MRKFALLFKLMYARHVVRYGANAKYNMGVLLRQEETVEAEWSALFPTKGDDGSILPHPSDADCEAGFEIIKAAHPSWF